MDNKSEHYPIILADFRTLNFLKSFKTAYENLILSNWTSSFFIPLNFENKQYILLNSGVNPFTNSPIGRDSGTIIIFTASAKIDLDIYSKKDLNLLNNRLTEENPQISSISLSLTNPKFYYTGDKEESGPEYRIIVDIGFVNAFNKTDVFNWKKIKNDEPTMLIGSHFDDVYEKKSSERGNFKNIEFDKAFMRQFLMRAQRIRYEPFGKEDIYFLDFPLYTDIMLKNFGGQRYFECEFRVSYEIFVSRYYEILKHNIKTGSKDNCGIFIKKRDCFYTVGDEQFESIIDLIYDSTFCLYPIWVKNAKPKTILSSYIIFDVIPNIFGYKFEKPAVAVLTEVSVDKDVAISKKIKRNSEKLIEEEERKKKIEAEKEKAKTEKLAKIAQNNAANQHIAKMKKLAKIISQEAREFIIKKEVAKKRLETKHLSKMKELAKIIAHEAKNYISNKAKKLTVETKIDIAPSNNDYCEIGSDEYKRRIKEWNFEKINPYFFCYPQEQIAALLPNITPKKDDMWLFNLWNYKI